jgi:hypothetical protein
MNDERYVAMLMASLEPSQCQARLNAMPVPRRTRVRELMASIPSVPGGYRTIATLLNHLVAPAQPRSAALQSWLATTPSTWASAIFRSFPTGPDASAPHPVAKELDAIVSDYLGDQQDLNEWAERFPSELARAVFALGREDAKFAKALTDLGLT